MPNWRKTNHPLLIEADALARRLYGASVYYERHPQYTPRRLEVAAGRAASRLLRRLRKYGEPMEPSNRLGRASTQDRPYAVGGRGRRGW